MPDLVRERWEREDSRGEGNDEKKERMGKGFRREKENRTRRGIRGVYDEDAVV